MAQAQLLTDPTFDHIVLQKYNDRNKVKQAED